MKRCIYNNFVHEKEPKKNQKKKEKRVFVFFFVVEKWFTIVAYDIYCNILILETNKSMNKTQNYTNMHLNCTKRQTTGLLWISSKFLKCIISLKSDFSFIYLHFLYEIYIYHNELSMYTMIYVEIDTWRVHPCNFFSISQKWLFQPLGRITTSNLRNTLSKVHLLHVRSSLQAILRSAAVM